MSNTDGQGRNVVPQSGKTPSTITLGPLPTLNLDFLPETEKSALMTDYAKGVIDVAKKAHELHVDVAVLKSTLDQLAQTTKDVSESGNAVTVTHTQSTKIGRTEIKMGNTEEAKSGRLTSSQTGDRNWTPYYIFAGIVAVVLIAFLFAGHH
jgi:hypothetical protein